MKVRKIDIKQELERKQRCFYLGGVNINMSFDSLEKVAIQLGAELKKGDLLIVDNRKGNRRKAFKKTENGAIIVYGLLYKNQFTEYDAGLLQGNKTLISFF